MSQTKPTNRGEVLFVGLSVEDLPQGLADQIADRGATPFCCGDVYRALARIGRQTPTAIVAAIDWLTAAELEFFEILGRGYPNVPVYVVGARRAGAKIDRAIACGAQSIDALDGLASICRNWDVGIEKKVVVADDARSAPPSARKNEPPFALTGNLFDAELDRRLSEAAGQPRTAEVSNESGTVPPDESAPQVPARQHGDIPARLADGRNEEPAGQDENATRPARVPWQRYEGGPTRTPPTRVAPPGATGAGAPPVDGNGEDDPPLLSPEELKALLGDEKIANRNE